MIKYRTLFKVDEIDPQGGITQKINKREVFEDVNPLSARNEGFKWIDDQTNLAISQGCNFISPNQINQPGPKHILVTEIYFQMDPLNEEMILGDSRANDLKAREDELYFYKNQQFLYQYAESSLSLVRCRAGNNYYIILPDQIPTKKIKPNLAMKNYT